MEWNSTKQKILNEVIDDISSVSSIEYINGRNDTCWIKIDGSFIIVDYHLELYQQIANSLKERNIFIDSVNDEELCNGEIGESLYYIFLMEKGRLIRYLNMHAKFSPCFAICNGQHLSTAQKRVMREFIINTEEEAFIDILDPKDAHVVGMFNFVPERLSFRAKLEKVMSVL